MPDAIPPVSPIVPEPAKPPIPPAASPGPPPKIAPIIPPIGPGAPGKPSAAPQHPQSPAGAALAIRVLPADVQLGINKVLQLTAEVRAGSAVTGDKVAWTSDNARAVEVTAAGKITGKMPGVVIVRASVGKASGICLVTVTG